MEKNKIKNIPVKKASFCNLDIYNALLESSNAEIRLGIGLADEKAKQELKKRKLEAPLSIEEKVLMNK